MDGVLKEVTEHKEGIKFPLYKEVFGPVYAGLENTLAKPHGLKDPMQALVKALSQGPKRYRPLIDRLSQKYSLEDIETACEILQLDGVIRIKSKNNRPRKGYYWVPQYIFLDSRTEEELNQQAQARDRQIQEQINNLKQEVEAVLGDSDHPLAGHLRRCLAQKILIDRQGVEVCDPYRAFTAFRSVVMALAYSVKLQSQGQSEPLRVVSERVWGKSKVLERYKKEITRVAGAPLSGLNLTLMPDLIFFYGDLEYQVAGREASGLAGYPAVLAENSVRKMKVTGLGAQKILIIENLAVFNEVLKRRYYNQSDTLVMWSEGYLTSTKRTFLAKLLCFNPLPVFIWSDIDADGLMLTWDMVKFLSAHGIKARPVLMSTEELALSVGQFQGNERLSLDEDALDDMFGDVVEQVRRGAAMEQEELMLNYDIIKNKLP